MTEQKQEYEIVEARAVSLGTIQAHGPAGIIEEASAIATQLAEIVKQRQLYSTIRGRRYVRVEGWTTLGAMLGVLPREVETHPIENGYESVVELIRTTDGQVVGRGSAICTRDEPNWGARDAYAVRSMAITRATGKAFRLGFSWVMTLAGYESTPAEEMDYEPQRNPANALPVDRPRNRQRVTKTEVEPKPTRPFAPAELRDVIQRGIEDKRAKGFDLADDKDGRYRGVTVKNLELCFAGDAHSDQKRHLVTEYLTGKASSTELDAAEVMTIHRWLGATQDADTGEWAPDPMAAKEAQRVAKQAALDAGQQELEL